ncbi:hypothetical protein ACFLRA_00565 [Bdellovibrionota bacterium]
MQRAKLIIASVFFVATLAFLLGPGPCVPECGSNQECYGSFIEPTGGGLSTQGWTFCGAHPTCRTGKCVMGGAVICPPGEECSEEQQACVGIETYDELASIFDE